MSFISRLMNKMQQKKMMIIDEWFNLICDSYTSPPVSYKGKRLPGFPSDIIQKNTTGQVGVDTLWEAFVFYQECISTFDELGQPLQGRHKLLDFGVGWGRIARFFLRELPLENIYGVDVTEEFTGICRDTFSSDNFVTCQPNPPIPFADEKFDFIVGYSVFSHLSEDACSKWMQEFSRILSPGGIVALTTRGRSFFDYCEGLKGQNPQGYQAALANMFDSFDDARDRYDQGELIHVSGEGLSGGGAMNSNFYGETFIPEVYAKTAYSEHFVLEKFLFDTSRQPHPIMFFRKKG